MERIYSYMLAGIALFLLVLPLSLADVVVVNSQEWEDVYSGVLYASHKDLPVTFLNSESPDSVLKTINQGEKVILLESTTRPLIPEFENLLVSQGYQVETTKFSNANTNSNLLNELDVNSYIVVEDGYPYNAIIAAPYSIITNSWVFIVDEDNVGEVSDLISGSNNVLAIGLFKSSIEEELSPHITNTISTGSKFTDSIEVAERFIQEQPTNQVLITDGRHIEAELISGSKGRSPVILVGPNLLPNEVTEFLLENNIKTAVVTGNQLSVVGESIRESTNRETVVFIKFGIGRTSGTSASFSALTMFEVPSYTAKLNTESVFYSPSQEKLFVKFKNNGEIGVFEFTSLTIKAGDESIGKAADEEPNFIGGGETYTASFDVSIPPEQLSEELKVTLYTSYGESPNALENYITETGKYGPPLELSLEIEEIKDDSNMEIISLNYYKNSKKFALKVKNTGTVSAYADAEIEDIEINGIKQTINFEGSKGLEPGEEAELLIPADLTQLEINNLGNQKVVVYYGESRDLLVNKIEEEMTVNVQDDIGGITGLVTGAGSYILGIVVIIILAVIFLFWKKKR